MSDAERTGTAMDPPHPRFAPRLQGDAPQADWLRLTLHAELAADLDSPAENQAERVALQIELMNQGVRSFSDADREALLQHWCECGPKDDRGSALRQRFFDALRAAL